MGFVRRAINVSFTLGEGGFGEGGGGNAVKLEGLRIAARIIKAGGPSMGTAQLSVYGMTLSLMNQLSTLGMTPTLVRKNTVTVEAGDAESGMTTVFEGTITNAWGDFTAAPDVPFQVEAHTGLFEAVKPADPTSYGEGATVVSIMSSIATKMGLAFENTGVNAVLSYPYFWGSLREQAKACAEAAGIEWIIDNGKLAIWPRGQARGAETPLVSPATGMIGYPAYTSNGIMLRTIMNPAIGYGGKINVQSDLQPACGEWIIYALDYDLASELPGGPWFTNIQAARPGLVVVQ